jgi:hypothetical protein
MLAATLPLSPTWEVVVGVGVEGAGGADAARLLDRLGDAVEWALEVVPCGITARDRAGLLAGGCGLLPIVVVVVEVGVIVFVVALCAFDWAVVAGDMVMAGYQ